MAQIDASDDVVTIKLTQLEKGEALHGDVVVPRSAVLGARAVPNGMTAVHGLRAPGAGLPGVLAVGTFHARHVKMFAVVHGTGPAVVIELSGLDFGTDFDRIVVSVDDPQTVVKEFDNPA